MVRFIIIVKGEDRMEFRPSYIGLILDLCLSVSPELIKLSVFYVCQCLLLCRALLKASPAPKHLHILASVSSRARIYSDTPKAFFYLQGSLFSKGSAPSSGQPGIILH